MKAMVVFLLALVLVTLAAPQPVQAVPVGPADACALCAIIPAWCIRCMIELWWLNLADFPGWEPAS